MSTLSPRWSGIDFEDLLHRNLKFVLWVILVSTTTLPFVYAFFVSFRQPEELVSHPHWIPLSPTIDWWVEAFRALGPSLWNSLVIASGVAIISLLITIPGAYVFGRQDFPGKKPAFYTIIIALTFPYIVLVIPITDLWNELGLFNTIPGLWLAYQIFVTPFAIWILRDFFEKLPPNLEEAAMVYGCTQWRAFYEVMLPLAAPGVVAVAFLSFLVGWNDFLFSNMLTTGQGPRPAIVTLFVHAGGSERTYWGRLMSELLIIGTPPTILYMVARRYLSQAFALESK